ncbi:MAG: hypothetical protein H8D45_22145 [Bacteroidetes bacterium]|nr:hypothetical protein [Bacteroidota bacterium]
MKKILNIFVIGIFLMSMLPNLNLVSADNEIQLGESFHLGENQRVVLMDVNPGDDDLNDIRFLIINSENITDEMNLGEGRMMPAGINLDWMVLFEDEDNDERIGLNPERHIEGDIINADFDVTYTISILSVNYDEGETARYAELRVDRIGELANREEVVNEGGEEPNNAQVENIRNTY